MMPGNCSQLTEQGNMDTGLTRYSCRMVEEEKRERDNDENVLSIIWWM